MFDLGNYTRIWPPFSFVFGSSSKIPYSPKTTLAQHGRVNQAGARISADPMPWTVTPAGKPHQKPQTRSRAMLSALNHYSQTVLNEGRVVQTGTCMEGARLQVQTCLDTCGNVNLHYYTEDRREDIYILEQ